MSDIADLSERRCLALKRPDLLRNAVYVGGAWVTSAAGAVEVRSPATGGVLGFVPRSGSSAAEQAVAGAHRVLPA